jgi:hypothetical protein
MQNIKSSNPIISFVTERILCPKVGWGSRLMSKAHCVFATLMQIEIKVQTVNFTKSLEDRFEKIFKAKQANRKNMIFYYVMQCSVADWYGHFARTCHLRFHVCFAATKQHGVTPENTEIWISFDVSLTCRRLKAIRMNIYFQSKTYLLALFTFRF